MTNLPEKITVESDLCGEDDGKETAAWLRHNLTRGFDVETTLPTVEAWHRSTILSIIDSDCVLGRSAVGSEIEIGHLIMHEVEVRDNETGELRPEIRTVLPQSAGPPISFCSRSIIKAIQRIRYAVGHPPPYDPPIKVRLKQRQGGKGVIYYLQMVS